MQYHAVIQTPIGKLGINSTEQALTRIAFLPEDYPLREPKTSFLQQAGVMLQQYLENPRTSCHIAYQINGTAFQQHVWHTLTTIGRGQTCHYAELAIQLKTGPRAIGNACRQNPLPILIPCHRVVAKHGLGGFAGDHTGRKIAIKQWLLNHEQN